MINENFDELAVLKNVFNKRIVVAKDLRLNSSLPCALFKE